MDRVIQFNQLKCIKYRLTTIKPLNFTIRRVLGGHPKHKPIKKPPDWEV